MNILKNLTRFFSRHLLARELSFVLAVKITLLVCASVFLFGDDHRVHLDQNAITQHILE